MFHMIRVLRKIAPLVLTASALPGCAATAERPVLSARDTAGVDASVPDRQPPSALPPAMLGDDPITWDELRPVLAEAAGPLALEEVVLGRLLTLALRPDEVTRADIEGERALLLRTLARESGTTTDDAARLVDALRRARALGTVRFESLLRRNAMLRRLVRDRIEVTEDDLAVAHAVRYGPRYRVRVIVAGEERLAAEILARLDIGDPHLPLRFADQAARFSIDPSATRGGSLPPFNLSDPAYPEAVRRALRVAPAGSISDVVAVDAGYALFLVEEIIPGQDVPLAVVAEELRADVRSARERLAMDELARQLLADAPLRIHDRAIEAAWGARRP